MVSLPLLAFYVTTSRTKSTTCNTVLIPRTIDYTKDCNSNRSHTPRYHSLLYTHNH